MNQTVDILCRAKALYASAPSHVPLSGYPEQGTYCPLWALSAAGTSRVGSPQYDALSAEMGDCSIAEWNAEHSTAEGCAAFDRAIAAQRLVVPPLQRTERRDPILAGQESLK